MNKNIVIGLLVLIVLGLGLYILARPRSVITQTSTPIVTTQVSQQQSSQPTEIKQQPSPAPVAPSALKLTQQNSGQPQNVSKGQSITITLGNPSDGGYSFDPIIYDGAIVKLESHTFTPPAPDPRYGYPLPGAGGTDVWKFTAIKAGATEIKITADRPNDVAGLSRETSFVSTITVK